MRKEVRSVGEGETPDPDRHRGGVRASSGGARGSVSGQARGQGQGQGEDGRHNFGCGVNV